MYSYQQVYKGINKYLDEEIINKIDGWKKWIVASMLGVALDKSTNIFNNLKENELVKMLELIDSNNNIDVDTLYKNMKEQATKSAITFDAPIIGAITLNENDVDKLYNYIKE